jgi:hypothetical protein
MSISQIWVSSEQNRSRVLAMYRSKDAPTVESIAAQLDTTMHNVAHVLKKFMPVAERKALAKVRYSISKTGVKNPMLGKTGEAHHNWKGVCEDGHGYLTCLHDGKRVFVHRLVMAQALGMETLPDTWEVHHIDFDPTNNRLDNLALVTGTGHRQIHYLQAKESTVLKSRKSTIAEALKYMT